MKKVIFTNSAFYYLLLAYLLGLLAFNAYISVTQNRVFGVFPVAIQTGLLYLILTRNKFLKQAIIIWALIFLMFGPGMVILGNIGYLISGDPHNRFKAAVFAYNWFAFASGILILVGARKTILISNFERDFSKDRIRSDGF